MKSIGNYIELYFTTNVTNESSILYHLSFKRIHKFFNFQLLLNPFPPNLVTIDRRLVHKMHVSGEDHHCHHRCSKACRHLPQLQPRQVFLPAWLKPAIYRRHIPSRMMRRLLLTSARQGSSSGSEPGFGGLIAGGVRRSHVVGGLGLGLGQCDDEEVIDEFSVDRLGVVFGVGGRNFFVEFGAFWWI